MPAPIASSGRSPRSQVANSRKLKHQSFAHFCPSLPKVAFAFSRPLGIIIFLELFMYHHRYHQLTTASLPQSYCIRIASLQPIGIPLLMQCSPPATQWLIRREVRQKLLKSFFGTTAAPRQRDGPDGIRHSQIVAQQSNPKFSVPISQIWTRISIRILNMEIELSQNLQSVD